MCVCVMPGFHHSIAVSPFLLAIAAAVAYLFAVYGCNKMEYSYVIFTKQWNSTTAERRNGSGRTATEWWKPGIMILAFCGTDLTIGGICQSKQLRWITCFSYCILLIPLECLTRIIGLFVGFLHSSAF